MEVDSAEPQTQTCVRSLTVSPELFADNRSTFTSGETHMRKNQASLAFGADRDDRFVAACATVLVFAGGILSLLLLGSIAVQAIA